MNSSFAAPPPATTQPTRLPTVMAVGLSLASTAVLVVVNGVLGIYSAGILVVLTGPNCGSGPACGVIGVIIAGIAGLLSFVAFWYSIIKPWRELQHRSLWGAFFPVFGAAILFLIATAAYLALTELGLEVTLSTPAELIRELIAGWNEAV